MQALNQAVIFPTFTEMHYLLNLLQDVNQGLLDFLDLEETLRMKLRFRSLGRQG